MSPIPTVTIQQAFALALQHHQAGRLAEAEALYRQILAAHPDHADTVHHLGIIAHQQRRHDIALELIRRATVLAPDSPSIHFNLGEVCRLTNRQDEASAHYQRALQLRPGFAEAHIHLGHALRDLGRSEEAVTAYRRGLELNPEHAVAQHSLANMLREQGQLDAALAAYRRALELKPDYAVACNDLGGTLAMLRQFDEAVSTLRRALELKPDYAEACNNLGGVLVQIGQFEEAATLYARAAALHPHDPAILSNLILVMPLCPACDDQSLLWEQVRWNHLYVEPLRPSRQPHTNDPNLQRRLRIGYVSADFRSHALSFFIAPLLESHDRAACEIHCYASVPHPDAVTVRLRQAADVWHEVHALSDAQLAQLVREDGIDILVDLAMHTADHRLLVFARRPAPVQVSWLAYPGTTGVETIDYRLTDRHIETLDPGHDGFGGRAMGLPDAWCCYAPIEEFPAVGPLPAARNGTVTFGSLNQFGKVHEELLRSWATLLERVPRARLLIVCPEGQAQDRTRALFAKHGITPDRLELVPPCPWADYTCLFGRIDIALDAFPWNGMTTTCHALWMGVPTVTRAGTSAASRGGSSPLQTVGLSEWIGQSEEEYIHIAAERAADLPRLSDLRATLRARMQASPLMDAPRFARNIEAAYRTMWRRWCLLNSSPS